MESGLARVCYADAQARHHALEPMTIFRHLAVFGQMAGASLFYEHPLRFSKLTSISSSFGID